MNYHERQIDAKCITWEALVHVTFCFLVTNRYKSDVHDWASVDDLWPGSALWTHRCWWYGDRCLCWTNGAPCYEQRYIDVPKSYTVFMMFIFQAAVSWTTPLWSSSFPRYPMCPGSPYSLLHSSECLVPCWVLAVENFNMSWCRNRALFFNNCLFFPFFNVVSKIIVMYIFTKE